MHSFDSKKSNKVLKYLILRVRDQLSQPRTNRRSSVGSHGKKLFSRDAPGPSIVLLWVMSHDPAIFGASVAMNQPWSHQFLCSVHRSPFEPTKRTCERSHFYRQRQRSRVTIFIVENETRKWGLKMLLINFFLLWKNLEYRLYFWIILFTVFYMNLLLSSERSINFLTLLFSFQTNIIFH